MSTATALLVSQRPGSVRVSRSLNLAISCGLGGRSPTIPRSSPAISAMDAPVLSDCTDVQIRKGRGPVAGMTTLLAPYAQCLSSRRFMLSRPVKPPPRMSFTASIARSSGSSLGGMTWPATMIECSEPGRSTRYTAETGGCATRANAFSGIGPGCHSPNWRLRRGSSSSMLTSPTTTSVALLGLNQVRWNASSSSRVMPRTDSSVPVPVSGRP